MRTFNRLFLIPVAALLLASLPQDTAAFGDVRKEFTVKKGGTLSLELQAEVVQIITKDGTTLIVSAEDINERDMSRLEIEEKDGNVSVEFKPNRRRTDARFYITVPVDYNVSAEYGGGRFEIGDRLNGTLELETGGGNVDIGTITGTSSIRSGGGSVEARSLESDASISTGGGNLEIGFIGKDAKVSSGGGSMRLKEVGKDLELSTGGGNVRVGAVKGAASVSSGGGNVDLGPIGGVVEVKTGGGNLDVNGGSGRNSVNSGGGNVELERMSGSVDLKTGGGNVEVELDPNGTDDSHLLSGGGDVTLTLSSDAKATIEVTLNVRRGDPDEYRIMSDVKPEMLNVDEDGNAEALIRVNGGGQRITVETTDGDIRIRKM